MWVLWVFGVTERLHLFGRSQELLGMWGWGIFHEIIWEIHEKLLKNGVLLETLVHVYLVELGLSLHAVFEREPAEHDFD